MKIKFLHAIILFLVAGCTTEQPDIILLEAESFDKTGGWVIDQQFMDQMGSPYLLAHGLGKPVADALIKVDIQQGEYHVYVRTWNWVSPWTQDYSPGEFQILVNEMPLETTFGREGTEWSWIYGGSVNITQSNNRISLHDLTGFDGRCDAIVLTRNKNIELPNGRKELAEFRKKWLNLPDQPISKGDFDLVVVGGGMAGICSAISAARLGLQVALIQNRPVIGGNNSSEIRVHLMGSTKNNRYPNIGKVIRELDTGDPGNAGPAEAYGDQHKLNMVRMEKNIKLFLNMHVFDAEVREGMIQSVTAKDIETNEEFVFRGKWFSDCTGDGNLGYIVKADLTYGREGRNDTKESMAPEIADDMTMGSSNLWYAGKKESTSEFPEVPWAVQFSDEYYLDQTRADWRWESGFYKHIVDEAEYIRDLNLRAIYGNWSYLKNQHPEKYEQWELAWVAYIAGKRESRRLMGDVVLQQQDLQERTDFPDACVTTTWTIDLHFADSLNSKYHPGDEFYSWYSHPAIEPYEIPYRCLYSRNIENLFMAGRCISVSHVALGTVRVMRTGGMMGEVVGMAASLCKEYHVNPRDVYENHLEELVQLFESGVPTN